MMTDTLQPKNPSAPLAITGPIQNIQKIVEKKEKKKKRNHTFAFSLRRKHRVCIPTQLTNWRLCRARVLCSVPHKKKLKKKSLRYKKLFSLLLLGRLHTKSTKNENRILTNKKNMYKRQFSKFRNFI